MATRLSNFLVPLTIHQDYLKKPNIVVLHHATVPNLVQCVTGTKYENSPIVRRSGNYLPCIWDKEYIQSIRSNYVGKTYEQRAEKLKIDVKVMLENTVEPLDQLELINVLQRLGLSYHFEKEISKLLENIHNSGSSNWDAKELHETALGFRLLRQHGYHVPQGVFKKFMDKNGRFDDCIRGDVKGILSLYEASYYSMDNEGLLEEAWNISHKYLQEHIMNSTLNDKNVVMDQLVKHALELPLHWRITRFDIRWYIDVYERQSGMNPMILELAKLDFNIVQALYQQELKDLSRWWQKLGLGDRLSFARDRLVEAYLWGLGTTFLPQDKYCRAILTKTVAIVTVIDDVYDVYGSLDELELFTRTIERWDINSLEKLPDYMKTPFLALFNTVNEMAYDILRDRGLDVLPHLKKAFIRQMKAYMCEARWYHSGYKPNLEEYINNAWISVAAPLLSVLVYISTTKEMKKKGLEFVESDVEIIRLPATIFRICDDFGTSSDELKRGDVPKAIQCHMYDTGSTKEASRAHMRDLIRQSWKVVNRYRVDEDSPLPYSVIETVLNVTRTSHIFYQYGDGHGVQEGASTNWKSLLLVEPIPL